MPGPVRRPPDRRPPDPKTVSTALYAIVFILALAIVFLAVRALLT